jgi:hypothetical protein
MWTDDRHAPVVFFDAVPAVGVYAGIVGVTLSVDLARTIEPSEVTVTHTVIAYLRTSVQGAMLLRDNLDKAILMAMPKPETSN